MPSGERSTAARRERSHAPRAAPRSRRTRPGSDPRARERGFTYLGLLVLVVLIGLALGAAGEVAATTARRDREAQLLWVGHQYRAAIQRYWVLNRRLPQTLAELLGPAEDAPIKVRYLRRLYRDPMTNAADWDLVTAPNGAIMGVRSKSRRAPLKTGGFEDVDAAFVDAKDYGDWQFVFVPGGRRWRPAVP